MPKFRKKPVVVEATQWLKAGDHPSVMSLEAYADKHGLKSPLRYSADAYVIETLEGHHDVTPGDWIITGIKGERYPCKPDIFAATYEAVE